MRCTCCGSGLFGSRWEQHWNQDRGFTICHPCVTRWYRGKGHSESDIRDLFGTEGVNFPNAEQWAELEREDEAAWAKWKAENLPAPAKPATT